MSEPTAGPADRRAQQPGQESAGALPPLPKVQLPAINRAPVDDRSTAGYLARTPGIAGPASSEHGDPAASAVPQARPAARGGQSESVAGGGQSEPAADGGRTGRLAAAAEHAESVADGRQSESVADGEQPAPVADAPRDQTAPAAPDPLPSARSRRPLLIGLGVVAVAVVAAVWYLLAGGVS